MIVSGDSLEQCLITSRGKTLRTQIWAKQAKIGSKITGFFYFLKFG